ncbi:uncharacterized protein LOC128671781 [Plodia interpunctella]|uniref:uncharacterized protein LOC128671781 n=1 Tax=Plodia interpunctella TaxID=58824 RepID=UPI002367A1E2|nr:uncharacterized protein LOC128671781 [Plodia interpunctella]
MDGTKNEQFEFIQNKRGNDTLLYKRHRYNLNIINTNGSSLWRCNKRKICSATVTIDSTRKTILRKSKTGHTCGESDCTNKLAKLISSLKKAVCNDLGPVQNIFEEKTQNLNPRFIPKFRTIKDSLYRARKKYLKTNLLNCNNTKQLKLPEAFTNIFLLIEDRCEDEEKIFIFGTRLGRKIAKNHESYFADGTFKTVPKPFYQLYVLHLDLNSTKTKTNIIPVFYTLLPNKKEKTYLRVFALLKEKLGINVKSFKCDYEKAQMNAVSAVFPQAKISGCYHHFNDAIWRYSKKIKLNRNREGRNITRKASVIPLFPASRIPEAWRYILESSSDNEKFIKFRKYFEMEWYPRLTKHIKLRSSAP